MRSLCDRSTYPRGLNSGVIDSLQVETNSGDSGDDLTELELVVDSGLTRVILESDFPLTLGVSGEMNEGLK